MGATSMQRPMFATAALACRREFSDIAIVHVNDELRTRIILDADDVRRFANDNCLSTDPWIINEVATILAKTAMIESPGTVDARWIVTFRDVSERDRLTIVIDRFGRRATFEGRAVAIDGSPLVHLLHQVMSTGPRR